MNKSIALFAVAFSFVSSFAFAEDKAKKDSQETPVTITTTSSVRYLTQAEIFLAAAGDKAPAAKRTVMETKKSETAAPESTETTIREARPHGQKVTLVVVSNGKAKPTSHDPVPVKVAPAKQHKSRMTVAYNK